MLVDSLAQNNQYLPPDKGYAYDKPNQQFPSSPQPQPSPGRPAPSYGPPSQDNVST